MTLYEASLVMLLSLVVVFGTLLSVLYILNYDEWRKPDPSTERLKVQWMKEAIANGWTPPSGYYFRSDSGQLIPASKRPPVR